MSVDRRTAIEIVVFGVMVAGFFVVDWQGDQRADDVFEKATAQIQMEIEQAQYEQDVKRTEELRAGCGSQNAGVRRVLYDFIGGAITRVETASETHSGAELESDIEARTTYKAAQQDMIDAVAGVAKEKGSPEVDCDERYTLPELPDSIATELQEAP